MASLFIVERYPAEQWDARTGWVQTSFSAGIMVGTLLAGGLHELIPRSALLVAAALAAPAVVLGVRMTPEVQHPRPAPELAAWQVRPSLVSRHADHPSAGLGLAALWPLPHLGRFERATGARVRRRLYSPFGLFQLAWLVSRAGTGALHALYPLILWQLFGIAPLFSSIALAAFMGLGLTLYAPAGRWSKRWGAIRVVQGGLVVRLLAMLVLAALGSLALWQPDWAALPAYLFVVLAWPVLSVSSTVLTMELSPAGRGEGMGLYHANLAISGLIGVPLGGWLAERASYNALLMLGAVGLAIGLLLILPLRQETRTLSSKNR
jgi:predicted MFS family arabinose efflux permease